MSEQHDEAAGEGVPAVGRNWKKVAIIGGGALGALLLIVGVIVTVVVMSRSEKEPPKPAAVAEHTEEPVVHHEKPVEIASSAHAEMSASDSHAEASQPIVPPHVEENKGLQAEILALQEEKRTLLQEQVELLKQQKAMMQQGGGISPSSRLLSGDKNCQLSGNPATRNEELRNCFGLAAKKNPLTPDVHGGAKPEASKEAHGAVHDPAHWEYSGEAGPEYWGKLKPEFATCATGQTQSPINIVGQGQSGAPKLEFNYKPSELRLINNGHTIQVNYAAGSQVLVDGQAYELLQFHFHTPSEELINGRAFDMVIHLVHKNKAGQLAVVGVLLKQGADQSGLSPIWPNLPIKAGPEKTFPSVKIDANKLLPPDLKRYYSFSGSLTTPPCTEGVRWFVMKTPVTLSASQFKRFTDIYSYNARPVQPLYKRVITEN